MDKKDDKQFCLLKKLHCCDSLDSVLDILVDEINALNTFSYGICLPDTENKNLLMVRLKEKEEIRELQENIIKNFKFSLDQNHPFTDAYLNKKELYLTLKDVEEYSENLKNNFEKWGFQYIVCLPIHDSVETVGLVALNYQEDFNKEEIKSFYEYLSLFINPLRNALELNHLKTREEEINNFYVKNERILQIAEHINNLNSLDTVYHTIINEFIEIFHFDTGMIFLKSEDRLIPAFSWSNTHSRHDMSDVFQKASEYIQSVNGYDLTSMDSYVTYFFLSNTHNFIYNLSDVVSNFPLPEKDATIISLLKNIKSRLLIPIRKNGIPIGMVNLISLEKCVELTPPDFKIIESLCSFIGTAIENSKLYTLIENQKKSLEEKERIISEDLNMAKRIQQNVISSDYKRINDLDFFIRYQPQTEIGGDIYEITEIKPGYYRIFIADATGHGIQASLTTMIIKNEYDMVKLKDDQPSAILTRLNESFYNKYFHLTVFFTCAVIDIDKNQNKIIFSSAGHPDQYLITAKDLKVLPSCGKMIGIFENTQYQFMELDFKNDDKLFLFTDGIYETFNPAGDEFGDEHLKEIIKNCSTQKINEIGNTVLNEVTAFMGNKNFDDDVTIIGIALSG